MARPLVFTFAACGLGPPGFGNHAQVVLAVAPPPLWSEFHTRFLKGRLMALTSHHAANFVVQAALAGAQGKAQVGGRAW